MVQSLNFGICFYSKEGFHCDVYLFNTRAVSSWFNGSSETGNKLPAGRRGIANQIFMSYPWYNVFKESKVHFCSSDSQRSLSFIIISKQFSPHPVKLSLNSCVCCHAASPSPPFRTASNITSVAPEKSE